MALYFLSTSFSTTEAAQTALDRSKDWVELAEAIGLEDGIDLRVIRIITDESELMKESEPNERAQHGSAQ